MRAVASGIICLGFLRRMVAAMASVFATAFLEARVSVTANFSLGRVDVAFVNFQNTQSISCFSPIICWVTLGGERQLICHATISEVFFI